MEAALVEEARQATLALLGQIGLNGLTPRLIKTSLPSDAGRIARVVHQVTHEKGRQRWNIEVEFVEDGESPQPAINGVTLYQGATRLNKRLAAYKLPDGTFLFHPELTTRANWDKLSPLTQRVQLRGYCLA